MLNQKMILEVISEDFYWNRFTTGLYDKFTVNKFFI